MKIAFACGASAPVTATKGPALDRRASSRILRIGFALLTLLAAPSAFAGANLFRGNSMAAPQGGTDTLTVNYIPDPVGTTTSYSVDVGYDNNTFTPTLNPVAPATCSIVSPGVIRIQ